MTIPITSTFIFSKLCNDRQPPCHLENLDFEQLSLLFLEPSTTDRRVSHALHSKSFDSAQCPPTTPIGNPLCTQNFKKKQLYQHIHAMY